MSTNQSPSSLATFLSLLSQLEEAPRISQRLAQAEKSWARSLREWHGTQAFPSAALSQTPNLPGNDESEQRPTKS